MGQSEADDRVLDALHDKVKEWQRLLGERDQQMRTAQQEIQTLQARITDLEAEDNVQRLIAQVTNSDGNLVNCR